MGTLNNTGYDTTTYAAKRAGLVTVFEDAFDGVRTDEESPQGQIIDYVTSLVNNEDKVGLEIFNQLNYRNATGSLLSAIAITKGQPRRSGTKAVITCDFTSTSTGYTIPSNSIFSTDGFEFVNDAIISIVSSPQSNQLIARANGKTSLVPSNTLTASSYFPALTNIEITAIQDGTDDESDAELIARLSASDSESGVNDVDAIVDKLNALTDTTRVTVLENDTPDIVDGIPAYGIEAIVLGGLDADIAEIISNTKASGTPTNGGEEVTITDSQGFPRLVRFTRPTPIDVWARISIESREGAAISGDIDGLRQLTMDYINALKTGADVSRTPIGGIWGNGDFDVNKIELSFDNITYVETNLTIATREYALVDDISKMIVLYV